MVVPDCDAMSMKKVGESLETRSTHMKAMKFPRELQAFLDVAEVAKEETPVFTDKKRGVAALVSLRKVGREPLASSTNPEFLEMIETAC